MFVNKQQGQAKAKDAFNSRKDDPPSVNQIDDQI